SLFGFVGALIATPTALVVSSGYLLLRFCRDHRQSVATHLDLVRRLVVLNLPAAGLVLACVTWTWEWTASGGRATALASLAGCVILYIAVYLGTIRYSGFLDALDRELLKGHLPWMQWLVRRPA